ncbi:PREDICTED: trypsin beta-like, partial [Ceratosolen solmsi marchali]
MGIHSIHALVGSIDLRQATRYHIYWWITYNLWAASQNRELEFDTNDIAIIKLLTQVNETIIPALVSFDDNSNLVGLDAVIAGWGKLTDGLNPNILHTVNVRIISRDDCETIAYRVVQRYVYISERYLCTLAEPYALINSGDSGGPLIFGSFILGVNQGTCPRTGTIIDIRKANLHCGVDYYRMFINDL